VIIGLFLLIVWWYLLDLPGPKLIKFGIESKHSNPITSTAEFKAKVVESLREMKSLFSELSDTTGGAKL
jgi:hypothetical protein